MDKRLTGCLAIFFVGVVIAGGAEAETTLARGEPATLNYRSEVDGSLQPYSVYLPRSLPQDGPFPLAVVLHGTSGSHGTFFDPGRYDPETFLAAAEKHGLAVLCPQGRGATEWWGIGENDVFRALADFQKRVPIDPGRIYLTGHSMGGGGTTYLALRHPGVFAAAAPLVGTLHHEFPENARHTPFYFLVGEKEIEPRQRYIRRLAGGIKELGFEVRHEVVPGADHGSFVPGAWDRVFAWLSGHRLEKNPGRITHRAEMPLHGRAWWLAIDAMETPGHNAGVDARRDGAEFSITSKNVARLRLFPRLAAVEPGARLRVIIDGQTRVLDRLPPDGEIVLENAGGSWKLETRPEVPFDRGAYRASAVARAAERFDAASATGHSLLFWAADALRHAADTDLALLAVPHYRGLAIEAGPVTEHDLVQCVRPGLMPLGIVRLTGHQVLAILEANLNETARTKNISGKIPALIVSGMRLTFDPSRPEGSRIGSHSLDPEKVYRVCLGENALLRRSFRVPENAGISEALSGFDRLPVWTHAAYYGYAVEQGTLRVGDLDRIKKERRDRF